MCVCTCVCVREREEEEEVSNMADVEDDVSFKYGVSPDVLDTREI